MSRASRASAVLLFALAGTAFAQSDEPCNLPLHELKTPPAGMHFLPQTEVNQLVYAILSPSDGGTSRGTGGRSHTMSGAGFTVPAGSPLPLQVNGIAYGYIAFGDGVLADGTRTPNFDVLITFYDTYAPTGAPPFATNVIGNFRVNNITPNWGFIEWFQNPLQLVDANGNNTFFSFPDLDFAYEYQILETGTNNLWGTTFNSGASASTDQIVPLAKGPGNNIPTGTSPSQYFGNDPLAQGTATYADIVPGVIGSAANQRYLYLKLRADVPAAPPPTPRTNIGVVQCPAVVSATTTIAPGAVNWFQFQTLSDASVDANTYLDVTAASADGLGTTDVAMGLYNNDGNRVGNDEDNGDLNGALLSYGHGRRAAVGDSIQPEGANGDLPVGTYYLAVTGGGALASFGDSGFGVNSADTIDIGDATITISSNTGSPGCALPAPVAPTATDFGTLAAGVSSTSVTAGFGQVAWITFTTTDNVSPTNSKFLDITTAGTTLGDTEIGLYTSTGVLVSSDDDSGAGALSQLSFSSIQTPARPAFGDGLPAAGQDGDTLPAGQYYLCVGLFDVDFRADGWQARSDSGSRLTINVNFRTSAGCLADVNGDGNVDPDDLSDAISCFFDPACVFDYDGSGFEDPDDLSTYISNFFDPTFCL